MAVFDQRGQTVGRQVNAEEVSDACDVCNGRVDTSYTKQWYCIQRCKGGAPTFENPGDLETVAYRHVACHDRLQREKERDINAN